MMTVLLPLALASALSAAIPDRERDTSGGVERAQSEKNGTSPEADGDEEGAQPSTEIVVTARKLDAARTRIDAELGATAYSLSNDTIEDRPGGETGSIAAILGQTPGVGLASSSGLSSSLLTIRGSSAVQVRINNVVVPEAISDPADRISSRLAASTKVITGTLPAQFGFAPGGIVSVTTKNGLYQHGGQIEVFAGNHGVFEPAMEWSGSTGATSLFGSGSYETGTSQVSYGTGSYAPDRRHEFGGLVYADHVIDDENRVSAIFGGSSLRNRIGATAIRPGLTGNDSFYAVGSWQHSTSDLTVQSSLFFGQALAKADFANSERMLSSTMGTQIDASYRVGAANTLRAGLFVNHQLSRFSGSVAALDRRQRTTAALYLQDQLDLTDALTLNGGARIDWLRGLGGSATLEPRVSMVWSGANGLSLHAGYARYAAAPSIDSASSATALPDESDDYLGAGVQQEIGPATIGVDGYWRSAHNLIFARSEPGTVEPQSYAFRRGQFVGIEFSATYAAGPFNAWANLSLSRARGQDLTAPSGLFPAVALEAARAGWVPLTSDRPVSGSAGVIWHHNRLALSADMVAGSGIVTTQSPAFPNGDRAPAYASFGLSAVYHLRLFGHAADVRADLTNLTDVRYLTSYAANLEGGWTRRDVGRALMIGIEQGF